MTHRAGAVQHQPVNGHRELAVLPPGGRAADLSLLAARANSAAHSSLALSPREQLTQRFERACQQSVAGTMHACQVVLDGRARFDDGEYGDWVFDDLKLGKNRMTALRVAQMLMNIGRDEVLRDANHWFALPSSWRTLSELVHLSKRRKLQLIADGEIHRAMTREDATALTRGRPQDSGRFFLSDAIAQLLKQKELLGDAEGVKNLLDDPGQITPTEIDEVSRWFKKLAKDWRARRSEPCARS